MDHYLLIARSVTHAQQMARRLEQAGIHVHIRRVGAMMSGRGCGYTLQIAKRDYGRAIAVLHEAKLEPLKVLFSENHHLREVPL